MYVVVSYDVETRTPAGKKRLRKVARACLDFGQRVQFSVFECNLGRQQWVVLRQRLLAAADLFVLASEREGLSFALLEAMAHGLAPIVTDIAENVEAVGDSGIAVPYGDENAIAAALRQLVEDENDRVTRGERARRRVAELFDAENMIGGTRALYDEVLGARSV